jgi:uncharacterized protein (TIGR02246 family)
MSQPRYSADMSRANGEAAVGETATRALYTELLDAWNRRDAPRFASLFTSDARMVGFDGSQVLGVDVETHLTPIFADHQTARYVSKIRDVQTLSPQVVLLSAIAGMVPPDQSEIDPALNAVQTLIAVLRDESWLIVLYQNTPAQHHGAPELVEQHTSELRQVADSAAADPAVSR